MSAHKKLDALLNIFHNAILEKDTSVATPAMKINPRIAPEKQLAIYIDGYRLRLIEAIRSDYPALVLYLGVKKFDELALLYIENTPSQHFNLDRYPHEFALIVKNNSDDEFAVDLAMLESAIARVFMMEESAPLAADTLTGLTPEALASMVIKPRTASCMLRLKYPADVYMSEMRDGHTPQKPEQNTRYLYLVRHNNEVKRHVLSTPEYLILSKLCNGAAVGDALEAAATEHPELLADFANVLQDNFAQWISNGFFR